MSEGRTAAGPGTRMGAGAGRLLRAWRAMAPEQRLAAYAAIGLFAAMFLPWYQRQFFVVVGGKLAPGSDSQTAWAQFSFVEAAVLLIAVGVITLLFQRAEGRAFHLPGGDGWVITAAGLWTCALIVWRIFDKQGGSAHGQNATTYGIEWGIFVALAIAAWLAYAGSRIRALHRPEPPLPGEAEAAAPAPPERPGADAETAPAIPRVRPRPAGDPPRERGWLSAPRSAAAPAERPVPARSPSRSVDESPPARSGESAPPPAARRRTPPPDEQRTIRLERKDG